MLIYTLIVTSKTYFIIIAMDDGNYFGVPRLLKNDRVGKLTQIKIMFAYLGYLGVKFAEGVKGKKVES